jgi:hypothetical protein
VARHAHVGSSHAEGLAALEFVEEGHGHAIMMN